MLPTVANCKSENSQDRSYTHTVLVYNSPTSFISIMIKITGNVFPAHVLKAYSGSGGEIQFHSILTLALG